MFCYYLLFHISCPSPPLHEPHDIFDIPLKQSNFEITYKLPDGYYYNKDVLGNVLTDGELIVNIKY